MKYCCQWVTMPTVLIALVFCSSPLLAVDCTPDSISLSAQSEVNDFQANHGPCDTISGVLTISGGDINDLSPLSGLTTGGFGSRILIQNNPVLTNLDGLFGLGSARWLEINNNPALTSINGLSGLGLVSGPVFIQGNNSLVNVSGLEGVTNLFLGALILRDNDNLSDLSGLSNLANIAGSLVIDNNDALTSLNDLSGLSAVNSSISIRRNDGLTSISGLSGIVDFSAGLNIIENDSLAGLEGLPSIATLNSLVIRNNPVLVDVDGLLGLTAVGTGGSSLFINNNAILEDLDGFAALVSLDADLEITSNPMLGQCYGLAILLDAVDDALPGPGPGAAGIPDVNGDVFLSGNLGGCNSVEEITGVGPVPPVELVPDFAGLGTAIGARAIVNPDNTCDWSPGETVTLSWDDPNVLLGQFTVDDQGCFEGLVLLNEQEQMAGSLPGLHSVQVEGSVSGSRKVPFTQVEPQLHLGPSTGPPGLELAVSGCHWGAGTVIEIVLQEDGTVVDGLVAESDGCLTGTIKAPERKNGLYALQAHVGGTPLSAAAYLVRIATVFLTPAEGPAGSRVPLSGCSWFPNEGIEFAFTDNNVVFDTAGSGIGGCITTGGPTNPTVKIPEVSGPGPRTIRATGMVSRQRVRVPFEIVERTLQFEPTSGKPGDLVSVSGCGWVGNSDVLITWGYPDSNNLPIQWLAEVSPATGCFGQHLPFEITVPTNSITGPLEQTAEGDLIGETTGTFTVTHGGSIELANAAGGVGETMTATVHDAIVGESITLHWGLGSFNPMVSKGAVVPDFNVEFTIPARARVAEHTLTTTGTKGFLDISKLNVVDRSRIEVVSSGDILTGSVMQVEGAGWSATELVSFRLEQGAASWNAGSYRVPSGTTRFTTGVAIPVDAPAGDFVLVANGDMGRRAQIHVSVLPGPVPAFALGAAYADPPPDLDGKLAVGEWDYEQRVELVNGYITARSDESRLYLLLNLTGDTGNDALGEDGFWLTFDIWDNQIIDSNWDLNFRLGEDGDLILEAYTGPDSFTPRNSLFLGSAYAAGFGCFIADGSLDFILLFPQPPIVTCNAHRVFEIGIDLNTIGARPGDIVRLGLRTHSKSPAFSEDYPSGFSNDFSELGVVRLAPSRLESGQPAGTLTGIGSNGFEIEVTQAIQDSDNSLRLVAGKDTAVRVYPEVSSEALVRTFLFGKRNGVDLPGSPLVALATIPAGIDRNVLSNTANFLLPQSWTSAGIIDFTAIVEDPAGINGVIHMETVVFRERVIPTYWVIPINSGSAEAPAIRTPDEIVAQESHVETIFPLAKINWIRRSWEDIGPNAPSGADNPDLPEVNRLLNDFRDDLLISHAESLEASGVEPFTLPDQIYGMTTNGGGRSDRLVNGGRAYVSSGWWGTSGPLTMAHEINHNIDRTSPGTWGRHTTDDDDTSDPDWGCGARGGNSDWPRLNDEIGNIGFDTRRPWRESGTGIISVVPANFPDVMSYCRSEAEPNAVDDQRPFKWTSDYRWEKHFVKFSDPGPAMIASAAMPEPVYYLSGEIHIDGTGKLRPARLLLGTPSTPIVPGDYSFEIQNAAGTPLLTVPFHVSFEPDEDIPPDVVYFHYRLSWQPDGARIVLLHLGTVLDTIEASPNPPTIEVLRPVGGELWEDVGDIEWFAQDLDGDDLSFTILYSPDAGIRWFPVARDLSGDSYQVNPWLLPGGTGGRIRIIATDGFHTVTAESAGAFTVPDSAPVVSIASPHNGQAFSPSEWIEMRGSAHLPDGSQDGLSFLWLLDGELIDTGKTSRIALEVGDYVLTLSAFGGAGNVGEASVNISVRDNDPPEPPASPIPADGSVDNELELVLGWIGADSNGDTLSYDVYMEAGNPAPSTLVCAGTNLSACPLPVLLAPSTTYYWRVVASDGEGGSTSGAVWEFTTRSGAPADLIFTDRFE